MSKKEKIVSQGLSFARSKYSLLVGTVQERKRGYAQLKEHLEFPELCNAIDYLDKNLNPRFKEVIYGNPLPKNYEELGVYEEKPYIGNGIISETSWILLSIRKYTYEINLFIIYKDLYEKSLLTGDFSEAEKYLDRIEQEICFSLWTLENRFLIKEMTNSSLENKEILNNFNSNNNSDGYTKTIAHFLSLRAEKTLSVNRFTADLSLSLSRMKGKSIKEHLDYYRFKLTFLSTLDFSNYKEILAYDFGHSVIDIYLNLVKVLTSLLTTSNYLANDNKDSKLVKDYVTNRLKYLIRKINDPILYKLKLFSSENIFPAFDETNSKREISIIDKYTIGLYQEAEEELRHLLLEKPTQFDLYVLYIKSLVYQKKKFIPVTNFKSIQNEILNEIFRIISVNVNPNEAGMNLLRIANNISSCVLSYGIFDFVFYQTQGRKERNLLSKLSFNPANPIIHEVYPEMASKNRYLNLLAQKFPNSITIDFFQNKLQGLNNLLRFEKYIPEGKFKSEYAKKLQETGNYDEASELWEYLIENYADTVPLLEMAIKNLFICYENLGRFDDCIQVFVKSFLKNNFIVEKIETQTLLRQIKENRFKNVKKVIELPIFYTIVNADENEAHIAFEQFNLSLGVQKPSELLNRFNEFEKDKILFYLKYTCSSEILKHSIFITGSKERLEERLEISQFLRERDIEDKVFYDDEIKNIQNILIIQKGLIELDESKIYVNEQGIINNELKDYEAVFQRFKTIAKIMESSKFWMLDTKGNITTLNYSEYQNEEKNKLEYSSNPVYDIYSELFEAIKTKFLYSQFGIVTYLSTRIRHGVLIGEIRPVFEKHHLITLKEGSSSNYRRNIYWDNRYNSYSPEEKDNIQTLLKNFSYKIDGLIFDLRDKHLQVYKPESNEDGWFDYDFIDDSLFWHSIRSLKARDFNDFAQQVFEVLWVRTDENLTKIREKIQTDIAQQFNDLFSDLERDISNLMGTHHSQIIVRAIKDCSTETQTVIGRISSWFKRSGATGSDFLLENLIDMVMEQIDKSNPYKKIILERDLAFNDKIKGEYLTHFADLLRIFMENILKHSNESTIVIPSKITAELLENSYLRISIENDISNKNSLDALKNVWKNDKIDISKLLSEGKSGYHKAFKILTSDLSGDSNLYTKINDTEDRFCVTLLTNHSQLLA